LDALIMRTINNMAAETLHAELDVDGTVDYTKSTVKAVNLLKLFNDGRKAADKLTKENAMLNPDFIRFAAYQIGLYTDRMSKISTLFNVGGKERFTPKDMLHTILLADFAKASVTFLGQDVYNAEHMALPQHETVPYWQGSGLAYEFGEISKLDVKT